MSPKPFMRQCTTPGRRSSVVRVVKDTVETLVVIVEVSAGTVSRVGLGVGGAAGAEIQIRLGEPL